jgi:general secretion pathway protein N
MKSAHALILGATAYGTFLLATMPAAVVAGKVASATRNEVTLSGVTGTVWNGSARVAIAARGVSLSVDEVRWQFLPSRLFAGRAAYEIEARAGGLHAQLEAARSPMAWQVRDLRANGDAAALVPLFPLATAWQPTGAVAIEAAFVAWDGERASGNVTIEWRDAALALSEARPLGSWRAQATAEGAAAKVALATTRGPLRLSGNGTLAIPGRLAFSGEARAEPGRERELEALLKLLGPRRADGAHALELR